MTAETLRAGVTYRCPVCRAEITLLRPAPAGFAPRCCNVDMQRVAYEAAFYRCPVCQAEVALLSLRNPDFVPRCCNVDMQRVAA